MARSGNRQLSQTVLILLVGSGVGLLIIICVLVVLLADPWSRLRTATITIEPTELVTPDVVGEINEDASPTPTRSATIPSSPPPQPKLTPPGRIVYTCFNDGFDDICIMQADGGKGRRLTSKDATDFYPSMAPDGDSIVFSSSRVDRFEIYELSTAGGKPVRLT